MQRSWEISQSYTSQVIADFVCVCHLSFAIAIVIVVVCTECIVAKRCVLEQKLQLTAYRKWHIRNRWNRNE